MIGQTHVLEAVDILLLIGPLLPCTGGRQGCGSGRGHGRVKAEDRKEHVVNATNKSREPLKCRHGKTLIVQKSLPCWPGGWSHKEKVKSV